MVFLLSFFCFSLLFFFYLFLLSFLEYHTLITFICGDASAPFTGFILLRLAYVGKEGPKMGVMVLLWWSSAGQGLFFFFFFFLIN